MIDTLTLIFSCIFTVVKYSLGFGFITLLVVTFLKQHNEDRRKQIKRPF